VTAATATSSTPASAAAAASTTGTPPRLRISRRDPSTPCLLAVTFQEPDATQRRLHLGCRRRSARTKRVFAANSSQLPTNRIGYISNGATTTFVEHSSTGRHFYVRISNGHIKDQNVKPLAFVF
jgi:hypothetical protein